MSSPDKNELVAALEEGLEDFREGRSLRTTRVRIKEPPVYTARRIITIRKKLKVSQPVFALYIGVSLPTVRAWEQRQRQPLLAARRLLQVAEEQPEVLRELAEA